MTRTYDVIVVGLGGMGSATAAHLARRGRRVLGLERFGRAHDHGSSHGRTRMVRHAYFEHPDYVPLLTRAYALWDDLGAAAGEPVLTRTGGLMIGAPDSAAITGTRASAERHGLAHEVLDRDAVAARFPTMRLAEDELAVFETAAGFVAPEAVVDLHCAIAAAAGAELRFDAPVAGWRPTRDGVVVEVGGERVEAEQLVLALGAWAPALVPGLAVDLAPERHVQYWFAVAGEWAERWALGAHPAFMWELRDGTQFYGFPTVGGPGAGVKVAFFRQGHVVDPDRLDRTVSEHETAAMRAAVAPRLHGVEPALVHGEPCLYTMTPDHQFIVDRHPETDRALMLAGFSGHGFKFVPVIGEIAADLVVDGSTGLPIDAFSLDPATRRRETVPAV